MTIKDKRLDTINRRICDRVRSRFERVNVINAQGVFNYQCFNNAIQWAKKREGFGVAEVVYIDEDIPVLHYINTKDGEYYETTLGWRAETVEYYKIRDVCPAAWLEIREEFSRSLEVWLLESTTWADRTILGINRVL